MYLLHLNDARVTGKTKLRAQDSLCLWDLGLGIRVCDKGLGFRNEQGLRTKGLRALGFSDSRV